MKKLITFILALVLIGTVITTMGVTALAADGSAELPTVTAPAPTEAPEDPVVTAMPDTPADAAPTDTATEAPAVDAAEDDAGDIEFIEGLGVTPVAAIVIICLLVGKGVKISPLGNEAIPVIVGAVGGILGVIGLYVMPDFPAADILTAVAVGIASGLAATGIHQAAKQITALKSYREV